MDEETSDGLKRRRGDGNSPDSDSSESVSKRQSSLRSLCGLDDKEFVLDETSDSRTDHKSLDTSVTMGVKMMGEVSRATEATEDELAADIVIAVARSCSNIDPMYQTRSGASSFILVQSENFKALLLKCWEHKEFRDIRNFRALHAPIPIVRAPKGSPHAEYQANESRQKFFQAANLAWGDEYSGTTHTLFQKVLNQMNHDRKGGAYANYLPIVQSSGTGKSRLMDEFATLVFTIIFNVREDDSKIDRGFPPTDRSVRKFCLAVSSFSRSRCRFYILFTCLFKAILDVIRGLPIFTAEQDVQTMACAWKTYLQENRSSFYQRVIDESESRASAVGERASSEELEPNKTAKKKEPNKMAKKREPNKTVKEKGSDLLTTDPLETEAQNALRELLATLIKKTGVQEGNKDVHIVICFDEAHTLVGKPLLNDDGVADGRSAFDALCSAMSAFAKQNVFFVVMSTNSTLSRFSPTKDRHPSTRVNDGQATLQAPFTELPFDVLRGGKAFLKPKKKRLRDVSSISFMCKFGRPLFDGMLRHGIQEEEILRFARSKLIGREVEPENNQPNPSDNAKLAILGTRLLLEFEPSRESTRITEEKLVESHMRIVFSIPQHREYFASGYPSEPILAEAAAQEMHRWPPEMAMDILAGFVKNGLILKGERGELLAQLILTLAYDKAAYEYHDKKRSDDLRFSNAVPLVDFLAELFAEKNVEIVLNSQPDNLASNVPLKDAFKGAFVRFTHFARAGDTFASATTHSAWMALVRGMAIQCVAGQEVFDFLIPVAYLDEPLCEEMATFIAISIKNRSEEQPVRSVAIDDEELEIFPPNGETTRPYIALVMQLGVRVQQVEPEGGRKGRNAVRGTPRVVVGSPVTRQSERLETRTHPRYSIYAYGCSEDVYGVIENKDKIAGLLSSRKLFDEHPRQTKGSLAAVARAKPFFSRDCYDWIDEKGEDSDSEGSAEDSENPE